MRKLLIILPFLSLIGCNQESVVYEVPIDNPPVFVDPNDDEPIVTVSCVPQNLQDNIIAYYDFSNGNILDSSGNNNNLSYVDGVVPSIIDRNGNNNCALEFDGTSYLKMDQIQTLQQADKFSISLWFKTNLAFDTTSSPSNITNKPRYFILGQTTTSYNNPNQGLRPAFFVGQFDCLRVFSSNGGKELWESTDSFPVDQNCGDSRLDIWNHVVINYDSMNSIYEIYVNGVLTTEANPIYNQYFNELNQVFIGKGMFGTLDDIFIFDKVLSLQEVDQMMNLQPCCNQ